MNQSARQTENVILNLFITCDDASTPALTSAGPRMPEMQRRRNSGQGLFKAANIHMLTPLPRQRGHISGCPMAIMPLPQIPPLP